MCAIPHPGPNVQYAFSPFGFVLTNDYLNAARGFELGPEPGLYWEWHGDTCVVTRANHTILVITDDTQYEPLETFFE